MRAFCLFSILGTAACGASADGTYVGSNDTASIAVVRNGDQGQAYICAQDQQDLATYTRWFSLDFASGTATSDDWTLTWGEDDDDWMLSGPEGESVDWTVASRPDSLYEEVSDCRNGIILTDDGAVGRWCNADLVLFQVEPVGALTAGESMLTFRPIGLPDVSFDATLVVP